MKITIINTSDSHDCETCGSNYADGATVLIDGKEVLNLEPIASCFDGTHYDPSQIYQAILTYLGHEVIEENDY